MHTPETSLSHHAHKNNELLNIYLITILYFTFTTLYLLVTENKGKKSLNLNQALSYSNSKFYHDRKNNDHNKI